MTRLGALLTTVLLTLLAGCGSRQAIKPNDSADTPAKAASSPASTSPPTRHLRAPQALVTDEAQNRLLVIDLSDGHVVRWVPLPADPEDIAAMGNGGVAVVVSSGSGEVTVLDRSTLRPLKTFSGFDQPHVAAITPDDAYAYITDDARGTLTVIRLNDMKITTTLRVGAGAHHLAISPDERQVWVALGEAAPTITILSTVVATPPSLSSPVIDVAHPRVIGHLSPGFPAHDISFSPDGRRVWISSAAGPEVTVFDARSRQALFRVPVGPPPQHLALDGRYAYLTSGYGGTIEKVDASTGRVITRTSAPYGSFELAAADGYVTTASLLRGTLAIYTPNLTLLRVVKLAPATREVAISRP
jgi:DNA-binding beta-propeller fold protein YncE